jgi:1-phosphatidylinositol-4-phosphate 5-kinase
LSSIVKGTRINDSFASANSNLHQDNILGRDQVYIIDKDITVTEYAPDIFAHLRRLDGYGLNDLEASMDPSLDANVRKIFKSGEGMGKSGSFFFFSHDTNFLIKTMTQSDFSAFKKVFRSYFEHICKYPNSLLARIYGVYAIEMDGCDPVYLILMGNSKKCKDEHVKRIYDLKGSMVNREVIGDESSFKNTAVLKDKNYLRLRADQKCIRFHEKDIDKIMDQMGMDITLLKQFNLMDYSLLFVIEYNPKFAIKNPHFFKHDSNGELSYPLTPSKEHMYEL